MLLLKLSPELSTESVGKLKRFNDLSFYYSWFSKIVLAANGKANSLTLNIEMPMYKLCFFVPESHSESVKQALFDSGAGKIGDYDCCSWETLGTGQFRPLQGSDPFIGNQGSVQRVKELKVEMVCDDSLIKQAVAALKAAHPYEEPAYDVWQLANI